MSELLSHVASCRLPTEWGVFTMHGFEEASGQEHVALTVGDFSDGNPVLTRIHSECLTGDALGSLRCDCGPQLAEAQRLVAREGGVVVYLRGQEGRGVGLLNKIRAYAQQDAGADTVDAQTNLGLPIEAREYGAAAAILRDLGIERVRLLTNNPAKVRELIEHGIDVVETVPLIAGRTAQNASYLRTKRERMGHTFDA